MKQKLTTDLKENNSIVKINNLLDLVNPKVEYNKIFNLHIEANPSGVSIMIT